MAATPPRDKLTDEENRFIDFLSKKEYTNLTGTTFLSLHEITNAALNNKYPLTEDEIIFLKSVDVDPKGGYVLTNEFKDKLHKKFRDFLPGSGQKYLNLIDVLLPRKEVRDFVMQYENEKKGINTLLAGTKVLVTIKLDLSKKPKQPKENTYLAKLSADYPTIKKGDTVSIEAIGKGKTYSEGIFVSLAQNMPFKGDEVQISTDNTIYGRVRNLTSDSSKFATGIYIGVADPDSKDPLAEHIPITQGTRIKIRSGSDTFSGTFNKCLTCSDKQLKDGQLSPSDQRNVAEQDNKGPSIKLKPGQRICAAVSVDKGQERTVCARILSEKEVGAVSGGKSKDIKIRVTDYSTTPPGVRNSTSEGDAAAKESVSESKGDAAAKGSDGGGDASSKIGGNGQRYVVVNGRRYKVRKENRRSYILVKETPIFLGDLRQKRIPYSYVQ